MTFKNGFICSFDKVHEIINYMVPVGVVFNEHKEPRKKINSKYFFSDNCNLLPPVFGITFSLFRKNKDTLTDKQIYRFYNTHLTALHLIKNGFFPYPIGKYKFHLFAVRKVSSVLLRWY